MPNINKSDWLHIPNTLNLPYDEAYPYVVVNTEGEPVARFIGIGSAKRFLITCLERWGRIVDTSPRRGKHE